MNQAARKPLSLWHCLWGVPFLLAGGGFSAYTLFHGLVHLTDALTQVVVPGRAELELKRGPTYTVFSEEQSVVNGKIYSTTESIAGLECRVLSISEGRAAPIAHPGLSTTYSVGGRSGRSVLEFTVPADGKYEFSCSYGEGARGPETVLAVGTGVGGRIARAAAMSLGPLFAGLGVFLAVLLTVAAKRNRAGAAGIFSIKTMKR